VPATRHQLGDVLQVAQQVRRDGRVAVAQLKELQDENRRLKKLYVEAQLSADLLKEAMAKKW